MYLNIVKTSYEKSTANIVLNCEKESLFSKNRNKTTMPILNTSIHHSTRNISHSNWARKRDVIKIRKNNKIVCLQVAWYYL